MNKVSWDFPFGPMVQTQCSQCRGPRFNPRSELDDVYRKVNPGATTKTSQGQINFFELSFSYYIASVVRRSSSFTCLTVTSTEARHDGESTGLIASL